jgi:hypothetical protein
MFQTKFNKISKDTFFVHCISSENHAVYEILWKIVVEPDRPRMTVWRMRSACWITKTTDWLTLIIYNTYCISMAIMVTRTRLNVTFMRTDGRTVRHTHGETNSRFAQFCERAWKLNHIQRVADIWFLSSSRCGGRFYRAAVKCWHGVKFRLYRGQDVFGFVLRLTQTQTHDCSRRSEEILNDFLWEITVHFVYWYVGLSYYIKCSLLHVSATYCYRLQGGVIWRNIT